MHPGWAQSLRDQCALHQVAFLFKQWGEFRPHPKINLIEANPDDRASLYLAALQRATSPSWLTPCGKHFLTRDGIPANQAATLIEKLGKKSAGRLLDGIEHNQYPSLPPVI